jgi:type IV pilus assembly protein PilE
MHIAHPAPRRRATGFTLLEVMIVVAVLALLASIGLPSYRDYIDRGRRAEGKQALMLAAQRLERFYTDNNCYPSSGAGCGAASSSAAALTAAGVAAFSGDAAATSRYTLAVTLNAQDYTLTATPANGFSDARCGDLTLANTGARGVSASGADLAFCWQR